MKGLASLFNYQAGGPIGYATGGQISQIYQDLFGRAPDPGGLAYWSSTLSGVPLSTAYATIAGSAQGSDAAAVQSSPNVVADRVVENIYREQLGRPADAGGKEYYTAQIASGRPIEEVAREIDRSLEGYNYDAEKLASIYRQEFGRNPEQQGFQYWMSQEDALVGQVDRNNLTNIIKTGAQGSDISAIAAQPAGGYSNLNLSGLGADPYAGRYATVNPYYYGELPSDAVNVSRTLLNHYIQYTSPVYEQPVVSWFNQGDQFNARLGNNVLQRADVENAINLALTSGALDQNTAADLRDKIDPTSKNKVTSWGELYDTLKAPKASVVLDAMGVQVGEDVSADRALQEANARKELANITATNVGGYPSAFYQFEVAQNLAGKTGQNVTDIYPFSPQNLGLGSINTQKTIADVYKNLGTELGIAPDREIVRIPQTWQQATTPMAFPSRPVNAPINAPAGIAALRNPMAMPDLLAQPTARPRLDFATRTLDLGTQEFGGVRGIPQSIFNVPSTALAAQEIPMPVGQTTTVSSPAFTSSQSNPSASYDFGLSALFTPAPVSPTTPRTPTPQTGGIFGIAPGSTTATSNVTQAIVPQTVFPQGATGIVGYTSDNRPIYSEPRVYSVSGSGAGGSSVAAGQSNVLQSPLKPHVSTEGSVNVFGRVQDQGIVGYTENNDPIYRDPRVYAVSGAGGSGINPESNILQSPLKPLVPSDFSRPPYLESFFGPRADPGIIGYTANNEPIFMTPAFNSPQTEITMGNLPPGGLNHKGGQIKFQEGGMPKLSAKEAGAQFDISEYIDPETGRFYINEYQRDVLFNPELREAERIARGRMTPEEEARAIRNMRIRMGLTDPIPEEITSTGRPVPSGTFDPYQYGRGYEFAKGGLASIAENLAEKGRGGDTMLVHMAPEEVSGLRGLAMQMGSDLTINPQTGLPEAKVLKKLFKAVLPILPFLPIPGIQALSLAAKAAMSGVIGGLAAPGKGFNFKEGLKTGITAFAGGKLMETLGSLGQPGGSGVSGVSTGGGTQGVKVDPSLGGVPTPNAKVLVPSDLNYADVLAQGAPTPPVPTMGPTDFSNVLVQGTPSQGITLNLPEIPSNVGSPAPYSLTDAPVRPDYALTGPPSPSPAYPTTTAGGERKILGMTPGEISAGVTVGSALMGDQERQAFKAAQAAKDREEEERRRQYVALFNRTLGQVPMAAGGGMVAFADGGMPTFEYGGTTAPTGEPRMVKGAGDGMSDNVPANIEGVQEARLANDEFVIPADVVADIGNGSSSAGAKKLYAMMDRIRQARHGTTEQPPEIKAERLLPA